LRVVEYGDSLECGLRSALCGIAEYPSSGFLTLPLQFRQIAELADSASQTSLPVLDLRCGGPDRILASFSSLRSENDLEGQQAMLSALVALGETGEGERGRIGKVRSRWFHSIFIHTLRVLQKALTLFVISMFNPCNQ
jgi:hypothetical protein